MNLFIRVLLSVALVLGMQFPREAHADLFGGDVAVLVQIYANAIQQLFELQNLLSTGKDSLDLMRDINRGIHDGLAFIQMVNPKFNPGIFGSLNTAEAVLGAIQDLYGRIPKGPSASLQVAQDQSAAESISMNGQLFRFADQADEQSRQIIDHASEVNPQGAAKLTAQSIAVLIGVTTQVLRTNSMMLKMMGQDMAANNRRGKIESEQFKLQYGGLAHTFSEAKEQTGLNRLGAR